MTLFSSIFSSPSRVTLAIESGVDCSKESYQFAAGRRASVETLAVAHELGMPFTVETMQGAARYDNKLPVMQFLHTQGCPWYEPTCTAATKRADFAMLRWLHENGCPWYSQILQEAASSGNVEMTAWVMQELRKTREHLDYGEQAMASAAYKGHTAVCEYLRSQQCHWNNNATYLAASGDYMDTLRWLRQQGCPWYEEGMCSIAAERDSTALLEYLQQEDVVFSAEQLTSMLNTAGAHSKLAPAQ
jgi:hypothetical protein